MSHKILFTFVRVHLGSDKVQILAGIASVPVESSFLNLPCLTSLQTMRSLLLVILSTLVVLSATTGAISLNTRKLATVTDSKYVSTFPIRSLLAGHNVIKKRSLRSDDSNAIMEKLGNDAEERALTVSKLLDKLEKFIYGFRVRRLSHRARRRNCFLSLSNSVRRRKTSNPRSWIRRALLLTGS